jgi:hypothetical protein
MHHPPTAATSMYFPPSRIFVWKCPSWKFLICLRKEWDCPPEGSCPDRTLPTRVMIIYWLGDILVLDLRVAIQQYGVGAIWRWEFGVVCKRNGSQEGLERRADGWIDGSWLVISCATNSNDDDRKASKLRQGNFFSYRSPLQSSWRKTAYREDALEFAIPTR